MRALLLFTLLVTAACRPLFGRGSAPAPAPTDSLYWRAVSHLDAANTSGSTDSALHYLNLYLTSNSVQPHRKEATVLRQLARDALMLARLQAALVQQKPDTVKVPVVRASRDEEALREIQRLKDELAKANEELERIKKRLANPKPPSSRD